MRSAEMMQEFFSTVRETCFRICVTKPSSSLGSSEQQCLARCCDRYAEVRYSTDGAVRRSGCSTCMPLKRACAQATQVVTRAVLQGSGLQ